jgi:hypothetical protein
MFRLLPMLAVVALLVKIFERKQEARAPLDNILDYYEEVKQVDWMHADTGPAC